MTLRNKKLSGLHWNKEPNDDIQNMNYTLMEKLSK